MSQLRNSKQVDPVTVKRLVGYLERASEQGDASAAYNLAMTYFWEYYGMRDLRKGFECFQLAAERGHSEAMMSVGVCYEHGHGVAVDLVKAQEYFRRAAWMGNANGAHNAANCFLYGTSRPQGWLQDRQVGLVYLCRGRACAMGTTQ